MHPVLKLFIANTVSVIFKFVSVMGTNATSVFIDLLNDVGDSVGLGLLILGLKYTRIKKSVFYPFGGRRAPYVLTLLSIMIFSGLLFSVALFKVISILREPIEITVNTYSLIVYSTALVFNISGFTYLYIYSRKNSGKDPVLTGSAVDSFSDTFGSILALFTLVTKSTLLDIIGSLVISIVILISAISIGYKYFQVLIGRAPPREVLKKVINKVLEFKEVRDVNVFQATMITEDEYMLILEVEVDKDMEVEDVEKLSMKIEEEIKKIEPRFKHVTIEFVGERPEPKTYREILSEIEKAGE